MRHFGYSLLTALLIAAYGGRVCPIIEAASTVNWIGSLLAAYMTIAGLRVVLLPRAVLGRTGAAQPRRQFIMDLALFFWGAVISGIYPVLAYGSPPANGLKVFVGGIAVGFFFSLELALQRERIVAIETERQHVAWLTDGYYFPVTKKFALVAGACVVFTALIISAVVIKDLFEHFPQVKPDSEFWRQALYWVAIELFFVIFCFTGLAILVIASFAENLRLFFGYQSTAMETVTRGDLSSRVPVVTNDEFGVIARRTNFMIEALANRTTGRLILSPACSGDCPDPS